jgi:2-polyprenyl-3-methyl-5-hydroxy-6-metoxy-1,4-benzoquinol methylase
MLRERHVQPEIMDDPDMAGERHTLALCGLERINAWSGSARILWPELARLARERGGTIRVLDVATGAGDVPIRLWLKARRAGLRLELDGIDRSPSALEFARRRALERNAEVRFLEGNALQNSLPGGYDVVVSSLFLHHLQNEAAEELLRRMAASASRLVLVNDLKRSARGLLLAYFGTRLLSRSTVVHVDGVRSVRAGFTPAEVLTLAKQAGLDGATVSGRWPCRYLLTWRRS